MRQVLNTMLLKLAGTFPFVFILISFVQAHNAQPCYLEIRQQAHGQIHVLWKNLITDKSGITLTPQISSDWLATSPESVSVSENYLVQEWTIVATKGLQGQVVTITGLDKSPMAVLVQIVYSDSSSFTHLLTASHPLFTIEKSGDPQSGVSNYLWLGIEHIWTGIDHLLFVFGLLLLVKGKRRLLKTITAFTLAHSITLALATLGWVHVPAAPVEAVIALSILLLALELIRHQEGINHLTYQYPWMVAFVFGLLHGFGFAGALAEVGLPQQSIPLALVLFNAGVEIGQILFVAGVLLLGKLLQRPISHLPLWTHRIPPYGIGSLAAFWLLERVATFF